MVGSGLATIRTEFGTFGRQVPGYALEALLPGHGFDVARFLIGSEGTLGVVAEATVRLVPAPPERVGPALRKNRRSAGGARCLWQRAPPVCRRPAVS